MDSKYKKTLRGDKEVIRANNLVWSEAMNIHTRPNLQITI